MTSALPDTEERLRELVYDLAASRDISDPVVALLVGELRDCGNDPAAQLALATTSLDADRNPFRVAELWKLAGIAGLLAGKPWTVVAGSRLNGSGMRSATVIDGRRHGPAWDVIGARVWQVGAFDDDAEHGDWRAGRDHLVTTYERGDVVRVRRTRNGVVISESLYGARRRPRGTWRRWYITGELRAERRFTEDGHVEGPQTEFWQNGQVRSWREVVDGKPHGPHRRFYRDGTPRMLGHMARGVRVGHWRWYKPEGNIWIDVPYEDGVVHGELQIWDAVGRLSTVGQVEHGEPVGEWQMGGTASDVRMAQPPRGGSWLIRDHRGLPITELHLRSSEREKQGWLRRTQRT